MTYRSHVDCHILPALRAMALDAVGHTEVAAPHYQLQTIVGAGHSGAVVSLVALVDRTTGYTLLRRVDRKHRTRSGPP